MSFFCQIGQAARVRVCSMETRKKPRNETTHAKCKFINSVEFTLRFIHSTQAMQRATWTTENSSPAVSSCVRSRNLRKEVNGSRCWWTFGTFNRFQHVFSSLHFPLPVSKYIVRRWWVELFFLFFIQFNSRLLWVDLIHSRAERTEYLYWFIVCTQHI